MRGDSLPDRLDGAVAEPAREDALHRPALARPEIHDELVAAIRAGALDHRAAPARAAVDHPDAVQVAAIRHQAAVARATAGTCRVALPGQPVEMAEHPRLPLAQERIDALLRPRPAAARGRRHRNDEPVTIVDGHAQPAGAGGTAQAILHRSLVEPHAPRGRLDREDRRMSHRGTS